MASTADATPTKEGATPTQAVESQIKVTTAPLPDKDPADVASSSETEWEITIKSADGATSEVMLSPVSAKNPVRQEINIYMPGVKAVDGSGDLEKAKADDVHII
jgi:hypothetical protein